MGIQGSLFRIPVSASTYGAGLHQATALSPEDNQRTLRECRRGYCHPRWLIPRVSIKDRQGCRLPPRRGFPGVETREVRRCQRLSVTVPDKTMSDYGGIRSRLCLLIIGVRTQLLSGIIQLLPIEVDARGERRIRERHERMTTEEEDCGS
ncbi:hypothetical protein DFH06DRAFT_1175852 [Mycena polygramma]|nr:hypothetical protein DFH06DRAFT_1175852 [Mycena polygramma]